MKKNLLLITLIFTLILNQFTISALSTKQAEDENLDYAQKLKKVGVFLGSDKGFELDRPATRLEGIIMLIRLLGDEDEAMDNYYPIPFTDVPEWATQYVSYAYNYGLSKGISTSKFGSMDPLTNDQFFTFMARALGYDDANDDFVWNESIEFMNEIKFIGDDEQLMYKNKSLLRSDIAKLSYNLMKQPVKDSLLLLVDQLIQSGDLDPRIAREIGIYSPIQTDKEASSTISPNPLSANYKTMNINQSIEQGYPSPYAVPQAINATSDANDVITFTEGLSGQELYDSLTHKGFGQLAVLYEVSDISSYGFSDSMYMSDETYTMTTKLKKDNFYEYKYMDQFQQTSSYYQRDKNVYYEVIDTYLGNYSDPIEDLSKEVYGTKVYMQAFDPKDYPSYNPLILSSEDTLLYIDFTSLNDQTVLYLEKSRVDSLIQQWISLKDGLVIQEYQFDSDGIIKSIKKMTKITYQTIDDSTFIEADIDYYDLTLLIYALTNDDLESLQLGLMGTFSEQAFSFDLIANEEVQYKVHVSGYNGGDSFDNFVYISHRSDSLGNDIELRQFYDGELFHTVSPVFKTDEVIEDSFERLIMFNFDELGFRDYQSHGDIDIYTFEDTHYAGLRGSLQYYDYKVNTRTNKLESITAYAKESINDPDPYDLTIYTLDNFATYDGTLFEVPDDYKVIPNSSGLYYDGEHPYTWFYQNQLNAE